MAGKCHLFTFFASITLTHMVAPTGPKIRDRPDKLLCRLDFHIRDRTKKIWTTDRTILDWQSGQP